ncbi:LOW QUALITY PROTEIN: hypothetical protein Cgig2_017508 [Carnegiea gigantea]|uniref:Uncharacterized protein n=1 Tax=Carnegiea gigantea TaxID=171969 RepID=A0A9Q1K3D3_9CARY|nr:LOW QUALITY PROTEIN: hypothetical protein Cgig2_017508 [Carnegiea gigantea]
MTEEDVYVMLAWPTGPLEVQAASTCEPIKEFVKLLKQWRTTDVVEQGNKDEKEFRGKQGRDKVIDRVDHWKSIHETTHMVKENHTHIEPLASTHGSPPIAEKPCLECDIEREPPIAGPNDPIELSYNRIMEVTEEDVCVTLGLPTGPLEYTRHANQQINTPTSSNNGGKCEILEEQGQQKPGRWVEFRGKRWKD